MVQALSTRLKYSAAEGRTEEGWTVEEEEGAVGGEILQGCEYMIYMQHLYHFYTHHLTGESLVARLNGTLAAARGWAEKLRALRERGGTGADGEDEDFEDEDFEDEDEGEGGESEEETQEDSWTCAACTFQNRKNAKSCGMCGKLIDCTTIHSLCTLSIRYVR
jgi:hypothetical protein